MTKASLTRYAWFSICASIVTIALKSWAAWMTGSVGLLSDAVESIVNLIAAVFALLMLIVAARPPDEDHPFGHSKAEYFASGVEGMLILVAAASIGVAAIHRILEPQALEQTGFGLVICALASGVNFFTARQLLKAGKKHDSITLEADAHHLLTDVWTSAGVIAGVGLVAISGWQFLDPAVAIAVALNIVWTGYQLLNRSVGGLMDATLPKEEREKILQVFESYKSIGVQFHALRTRQAGAKRFVSVHVLVPGEWTVTRGHQLLDEVEGKIRVVFPDISVFTHLESLEDPSSWDDQIDKL